MLHNIVAIKQFASNLIVSLIIKNKQQLQNIKKKLKRILSYDEQNPNKLEQKISLIKEELKK